MQVLHHRAYARTVQCPRDGLRDSIVYTHTMMSAASRLFMSRVLLRARQSGDRVNRRISNQSSTRVHPWNQANNSTSGWVNSPFEWSSIGGEIHFIKTRHAYFSHTCLICGEKRRSRYEKHLGGVK